MARRRLRVCEFQSSPEPPADCQQKKGRLTCKDNGSYRITSDNLTHAQQLVWPAGTLASIPDAETLFPIRFSQAPHTCRVYRSTASTSFGARRSCSIPIAQLYQVLTKNLNKAISRNRERFPEDVMFQLTKAEAESLRFQIGTSNVGRSGRRCPRTKTSPTRLKPWNASMHSTMKKF